MDSENVNRWLTLGANLGVLVGIILLVVELNQNREMIRAQTRNELSMGIVDLLHQPASDAHLASIIRRANAGDELTPDEYMQFSFRTSAMYRYWENVHYQYRQGLYDEVEFSMQRNAWQEFMNASEAAVKIWCGMRGQASPEFVLEIEKLLNKHTCNLP